MRYTGVRCASCRRYVEKDQTPWDKNEWLCDRCHAVAVIEAETEMELEPFNIPVEGLKIE